MSVEMSPDQGAFAGDVDMAPRPNFSPFLTLHPNVTLLGTQWLLKDFQDFPAFVRTRVLSKIPCNGHPTLETLTITLIHPEWSGDIFPQFHFVLLANHLRLNKFKVAAVDDTGYAVKLKLTNELSPASLVQLVSSFPSLTDLDVCISKFPCVFSECKCQLSKIPIKIEYRGTLASLTKLRTLRLQEYKTYHCTCPLCSCHQSGECGRPKRPIEKVFPPRQYIKELSFLLPTLRHLASIEIIILGDYLPPLSEDEDEDIDIFSYAASVEVNYRFSVKRKSRVPKVILDSTHISYGDR
jgi:hypothetical protein